jgi:hypothetical protein
MDGTAGVSCGRIAETEHAIEGIRGDMRITRRRTDDIEEGQVRANNKMIQEKKQMKLMHQENLRAIEAQNRVLNDLQKNQVENNFLKREQDKPSAELARQREGIHLVKTDNEGTRNI